MSSFFANFLCFLAVLNAISAQGNAGAASGDAPDSIYIPTTEKNIDIKIENIGLPINSAYSEYSPVINADESMIIFTYRGPKCKGGLQNEFGNPDPHGQYFEDVMVSYRNNGSWSEPVSISDSINTNKHDACIALSADGQKLFTYKDNTGRTSGDIYISALDSNEWQTPMKLKNINSKFWEGSATISADMKTIYFCSTRRGGIGGRDIYVSSILPNGEWETPVNMGAGINTENDEDSPFIHPDGVTLYFSSKGHNTTGGYDIFVSHLILDTALKSKNGKRSFYWSQPENIGYPINTAGDDRFYVVSADGMTGYYSSERPGGYGSSDIYIVHQKEKHILTLIKGKVYANDKPVEANITVSYSESGNTGYELRGIYKSNAASGKYMTVCNESGNYNLNFEVSGFPTKTEYFDASKPDTFIEINRDIDLYAPGYTSELVNIDGTIAMKKDTLKPVSGIRVFLTNEKGNVTEQTTTDRNGYFKFRMMPKNEKYTIALSTFEDAIMKGTVFSAGNPYKGLPINDTVTKDDGSYELEIKGQHLLDFEGEALYAETYQPAQYITAFLTSEDGGISQQMETDEYGHFKFENVPVNKKYKLSLDLSLATDKNITVKGNVKSDQTFQEGLTINGASIYEDRKFEFAMLGFKEFECDKFFLELTGWDKIDLNNSVIFENLLKAYGDFSAEGISFKVQVGAYKHAANFNYMDFSDLGKVSSQLLSDGLTRFTLGEFKTLNEADNLKRKVSQRSAKDAFIIAFCRGERKLLSNTIKSKFAGK